MKMKLRRAISLAGSAVLLVGLLTGFSLRGPGPLAVTGQARKISVSVGQQYVVDATALNVRTGPGLNYTKKDRLKGGSLVTVLERSGDWARTYEGWVHTDYLGDADHVVYPDSQLTGVTTASTLNIRSGPGTQFTVVGKLFNGYNVTITETKDGWGKIREGWISLDYVKRTDASGGQNAGGQISGGGPIRENANVLVTATRLNIRQNPGTNYPIVGHLTKDQGATILEVRNGWGRIREGWISLNYVRALSDHTAGEDFRTGDTVQVTADSLRLRIGPGTEHPVCGSLMQGRREILQDVSGSWGRISGGWISLDYVVRVR